MPRAAAPGGGDRLGRGRTLQLAGGLTAAPTLPRVLEQMADGALLPKTPGAAPDAAWYVSLARAMKAAYAERLAGLGDAEPKAAESCTTHLTVCDADGTMVAMTTTLLSSMGSRVVLPESGVLMNNGVMWFDPAPGPAELDGARQAAAVQHVPDASCTRAAGRGSRPAPRAGGASSPRSSRCSTFIADFGMDLEAAAHHPRIDVSGAGRDHRRSPARPPTMPRSARPRRARSRSSSTACCRSISPVRT